MAKKPGESTKTTGLRRQAEDLLLATKQDVAAMPAKDVQQLVHELQVYQIELDMQNDELRRTQVELEATRDRYMDLYDFSPTAHLTMDRCGTIVEANLRVATLLGMNRKDLIGQPLASFFVSADQDIFHQHCQEVLKTGTRKTCDLHLKNKADASSWVHLESLAIHDESGPITRWRTALLDISERKRAEEELRGSEARLRAILDNSPGLVFLKDAEGRYLDINRQFERAFHVTREQVLGKTDEALFAPDQAAAFRANDLKVLQAGIPLEFEEVAMHDDGPHTSIVSKFPLSDGNAKPYALCGITTDITWRKTMEQALRSSDAFTRAVLNSLSAQVCVLDREGVIIKTNDAWKEFAQRQADGALTLGELGDNYLDLCRKATTAGTLAGQAILKGIERVLVGSELSFFHEYVCRLPEEECWFLMRVTPLKDTKSVVITQTDFSMRVRIGQALEQNVRLVGEKQKELEFLTGKLFKAQEQERMRIARELHDDFNQRLAALSVQLESMERAPIVLPKSVKRQLAAIRAQVEQLSDDLHDLAYKLHPSLLGHVGLEVAMRDHVAEFTKRTGLPVRFTAREVPRTLSLEKATNLFRVMQESLQNVSKHAQATEVTVKLSGSPKGTGVSVRDNGKGFDRESKEARAKGLGLVSMQERTRGLGGFLRVHSSPHDGTKICAWIPDSRKGT